MENKEFDKKTHYEWITDPNNKRRECLYAEYPNGNYGYYEDGQILNEHEMVEWKLYRLLK